MSNRTCVDDTRRASGDNTAGEVRRVSVRQLLAGGRGRMDKWPRFTALLVLPLLTMYGVDSVTLHRPVGPDSTVDPGYWNLTALAAAAQQQAGGALNLYEGLYQPPPSEAYVLITSDGVPVVEKPWGAFDASPITVVGIVNRGSKFRIIKSSTTNNGYMSLMMPGEQWAKVALTDDGRVGWIVVNQQARDERFLWAQLVTPVPPPPPPQTAPAKDEESDAAPWVLGAICVVVLIVLLNRRTRSSSGSATAYSSYEAWGGASDQEYSGGTASNSTPVEASESNESSNEAITTSESRVEGGTKEERSEQRQRELQEAHNLGEKEAAEGKDHRTLNSVGSILLRGAFDPFRAERIEKEAREDNDAYTKGWENARKQRK